MSGGVTLTPSRPPCPTPEHFSLKLWEFGYWYFPKAKLRELGSWYFHSITTCLWCIPQVKNHNCKNISLQKKRKEMLQKTRVDYELVCLSCSCSKIEITFQTENRTRWNSGWKSMACGCGLSGQEAVVKVASGDAHRASAGDEEEGGEERPIASHCSGSPSGLPRERPAHRPLVVTLGIQGLFLAIK